MIPRICSDSIHVLQMKIEESLETIKTLTPVASSPNPYYSIMLFRSCSCGLAAPGPAVLGPASPGLIALAPFAPGLALFSQILLFVVLVFFLDLAATGFLSPGPASPGSVGSVPTWGNSWKVTLSLMLFSEWYIELKKMYDGRTQLCLCVNII